MINLKPETCPLGYPCEIPENCFIFGKGISDPHEQATIVDSGLTYETVGEHLVLQLCDGPLRHGLNERAEAALNASSSLLEKGFAQTIDNITRVKLGFELRLISLPDDSEN